MFRIFREELDAVFREDGRLVWKLLAAAGVGSFVGLKVAFRASNDKMAAGWLGYAGIVALPILFAMMAVLGLSLKDVTNRRLREGQRVSLLLRWYLASGMLSLLLWVITAIIGAFVVLIVWASYSA
jgi:hypothetical protein